MHVRIWVAFIAIGVTSEGEVSVERSVAGEGSIKRCQVRYC